MVETTTVWMVFLDGGSKDEIEGILREDDTGLVFIEPSGVETSIPFAEITKVKRVMGSPVFMIRHGPQRHETAFYLTKPPPLGALGGQDQPGDAMTTLHG